MFTLALPCLCMGFNAKKFHFLHRWYSVKECSANFSRLICRVARFFVDKRTKLGKNIPNGHKIYQMATKYTKWAQNIPNGLKITNWHKTKQHFPFQSSPKAIQVGIFGTKIYHLATLLSCVAHQCLLTLKK
jgi:hypothetical protein